MVFRCYLNTPYDESAIRLFCTAIILLIMDNEAPDNPSKPL